MQSLSLSLKYRCAYVWSRAIQAWKPLCQPGLWARAGVQMAETVTVGTATARRDGSGGLYGRNWLSSSC